MNSKTYKYLLLPLAIACLGISRSQAQTLTHRYSFNDPAGSQTFADSVGGASFAGTLEDSGSGMAYLDGTNLDLDGQGDFGIIPAGVLNGYTQVTFEFWASFSPSNMFWTRVFAFGDQASNSKDSGIDYCHYAGGNYQNLDALATNNTMDAYANNNAGLNGVTNAHVTVVVDPVNNTMYYYNGTMLVSTEHNPVPSLASMNFADNLIGRSLYDGDPYLIASINEFRLYQGVVTASTIALNDATGPDDYITSPGTVSSLSFSSPVNPLQVNQSAQQVLTGNFTGATNLNLIVYGGVTYTSGNSNVLTISSNGLVKATGAGMTTIVAKYGSVSATNTLTVLALPTTMVHRYSFTSDASDSIQGANGTLMGNATISGGKLVLDGSSSSTSLSLPGNLINISTNAAVSFEAWVTIGQTALWSHMFEFGVPGSNVYSAPRPNDAGGFHEFSISQGFSGGQTLTWAHGWSNLTFHYVGIIDPTTSTLSVYSNGVLMVASYNDTAPLTLISTNQASLGLSTYGDPGLTGSFDEFRIYSGALSPAQVAMSDQSGPNSTNFNPGTLTSLQVAATNYPSYASLVAPQIFATYTSLTNFNMLPNTLSLEAGLVVSSSNPSIISVNANNMLTTYSPGTVTLTATYQGKTNSAVVRVGSKATLTHRYSFTSDASDSIGGANGTLVGTASVSGGQLQLDGGSGDYLSLPGGLLANYRSATMDTWATISSGQQSWSRLWEFADVGPATANELYFSPCWQNVTEVFVSFGAPFAGGNAGPVAPPFVGETIHVTACIGEGSILFYTNAVLYLSNTNILSPVSQAGASGSWIGYSPYGDPGIDGSVDEYRIYQGVLSPLEIQASDVLGPNVALSLTNATLKATASGSTTILTWPLVNAGFTLQSSSTLNNNASWVTLTNTPAIVGTNLQVTVSNTGTNQFYRLIH